MYYLSSLSDKIISCGQRKFTQLSVSLNDWPSTKEAVPNISQYLCLDVSDIFLCKQENLFVDAILLHLLIISKKNLEFVPA